MPLAQNLTSGLGWGAALHLRWARCKLTENVDSCVSVVLAIGVKESSILNNVFTAVNLLVVAYVVICGLFKMTPGYWSIPEDQVWILFVANIAFEMLPVFTLVLSASFRRICLPQRPLFVSFTGACFTRPQVSKWKRRILSVWSWRNAVWSCHLLLRFCWIWLYCDNWYVSFCLVLLRESPPTETDSHWPGGWNRMCSCLSYPTNWCVLTSIPPADVSWPLLGNYFFSLLVSLPRSLPQLLPLIQDTRVGPGSSSPTTCLGCYHSVGAWHGNISEPIWYESTINPWPNQIGVSLFSQR